MNAEVKREKNQFKYQRKCNMEQFTQFQLCQDVNTKQSFCVPMRINYVNKVPRALRAYRSRFVHIARASSSYIALCACMVCRLFCEQQRYSVYMYTKLIVSSLRKLVEAMQVLSAVSVGAICAWHRKHLIARVVFCDLLSSEIKTIFHSIFWLNYSCIP